MKKKGKINESERIEVKIGGPHSINSFLLNSFYKIPPCH